MVSRHEIGSPTQRSYRAGGLVSIVSYSSSSRFQPGEGPSGGLLRDYEPSDGTFWSTSDNGDDDDDDGDDTNNAQSLQELGRLGVQQTRHS